MAVSLRGWTLALCVAVVPLPTMAGLAAKLLEAGPLVTVAFLGHKIAEHVQAGNVDASGGQVLTPRALAYNARNRARAAAALSDASGITLATPEIVERERGNLCSPSVLYMSLPAVRMAYPNWVAFANALAMGDEKTALLYAGMSSAHFQQVVDKFGGPSDLLRVSGHANLVTRILGAVDEGRLVFVSADVIDVLPRQNTASDHLWLDLAVQGRLKLGAPHSVRVLGLLRDDQGAPTQVLLYDANTHPSGSAIPFEQFVLAMHSDKPYLIGMQYALILRTPEVEAIHW